MARRRAVHAADAHPRQTPDLPPQPPAASQIVAGLRDALGTPVTLPFVFALGLVAAHHAFLESSKHWDADAGATVPRPELIADLAALLRPNATKQYALIMGQSGTGKSTAFRAAVRSLPHPKRAVYSAPELLTSFSSGLARATGYLPPLCPPRQLLQLAGRTGLTCRWLRRASGELVGATRCAGSLDRRLPRKERSTRSAHHRCC